MNVAALPNRRVEAWRYSDLRAAMSDAAFGAFVEASSEREDLAALAQQANDVIGALAASYGEVERRDIKADEECLIQFGSESFAPRFEVLRVAPGARLTRVIVQKGVGVSLFSSHIHLEKGAKLRQFVLAEGGKLARVETHVFAAEGAEAEINGVYVCDAGRHADLTSVILHAAPHGQTRQLIKGVARKGGRGVFQGKIVVAPHAQKTDAQQYHHGMLLEDGAEIFAKPELMIHADDVQCAHGNTAGGLDESALFYLRSRGVPEAEARGLLIEAFLLEALPADFPASLREGVELRIRGWLGEARS